ncbi:MAG: SUMF1/EgtB/PvdO family nonheme iron enzyme [Proteobacteria bacterium]|nr:SUMF1/EgtB/PvdO family nonheme iron enzyme [Pseudomonadota bacterium]
MAYRLSPRSDAYCKEDQLGFDKYVDTLHGIIKDKDFLTPFCIGIYGKWGSGKTSFMRLLEKRLLKEQATPYVIPAWFNPWRYEKEEHLIIPFLINFETEITKYIIDTENQKKKIPDGIRNTVQKLSSAASAILYGLKADLNLGLVKLQFDAGKSNDREEALAKKQLTQAGKLLSVYYDVVTELKNTVVEENFRIAVFVDDLDRCLPDKAVELLESIKLFLDLKGYLFVIGVDKNVVTKGILYHYRFFESKQEVSDKSQIISPEEYLDKMIQLPFELPPIELGRKQKFIESLLGDSAEFKEHSDIIEIGIGDNPRTLKRFINLLAFTVRLAETIKENILQDKVEPKEDKPHKELLRDHFIPILYVKWTIIVFRFPKDYQDIKGNKKRLIEMQEFARGEARFFESREQGEAQSSMQLNERLKKVLSKGQQFPDDDWLLDRFIHLTESTIISDKEAEKIKAFKQTFVIGEMVRIAKGDFLYGDAKAERSIAYDYDIDVFPITNKRYKDFLDENKELPPPYRGKRWAEPYNWDRDTRNYPKGKSDHPVVLVSYRDAEQFCKWRSQKEGKKYRLPSEEEWEKAARGTDGREFPWGNEFEKDNCNVHESSHRGTTKVNRYSDSTSPFGCYDMSGNVLEWTATWLDTSQRERVLRGGSWTNNWNDARCAYRNSDDPDYRSNHIGFRCVRSLK